MDDKDFLGTVVGTPGAVDLLKRNKETPTRFLHEHVDSHVPKMDKETGNFMSQFIVGGEKLWIVTEPDHSVTTLLLPEDY
jgi:hypothetical protein